LIFYKISNNECFINGWGSVVATLSTAFIPETAVAFALACAAKNGC
jgi:hypothetical protein